MEQGPHSAHSSTFVVLENTAKLKPVSKWTFFWWRERTLSLAITLFWCSNWRKYNVVKEILVFWSIGYIFLMDDNSKHKVDDSDDGWMLDSEKNWGGGVWSLQSNCQNVSIFIVCFVFLPHPSFAPLSPSITWSRGKQLTQNYLVQKELRFHNFWERERWSDMQAGRQVDRQTIRWTDRDRERNQTTKHCFWMLADMGFPSSES